MTQLEIYNAALGMIGHDRTLSSTSGTETEAVRCNTYYAAARRAMFCLYDWKWLSTEASITAGATLVNGMYAHTAITGLLRVLSVTDAAGMPLVYDMVGSIIRTDARTVVARYIADNETTASWPDLITDAVVAELAARICVPMTGNVQRSSELHAQALGKLAEAAQQSGDPPAQGSRKQEE